MGSSDLLLSTRLPGVALGEGVLGVRVFSEGVFGEGVFGEALCSIETGDFTSFDFIFG